MARKKKTFGWAWRQFLQEVTDEQIRRDSQRQRAQEGEELRAQEAELRAAGRHPEADVIARRHAIHRRVEMELEIDAALGRD
ncbi:hypothetical protein RE9425_03370 [Prescottella equi]|nr:hypothetical protein RE9425_03370 [Prescottella equi]